jgi:hypothetical protein
MDELLRRREQLVELCESQRVGIAVHVGGLARPIAIADRAFSVVQYLRSHPLLLGTAVATMVVMRRVGLLKWGKRAVAHRSTLVKWGELGLVAWRGWRALRNRRASV